MTSPSPAPGRSAQSSVGRAAVAGLCGGMFIGGVGLLVLGLRGLFGQPNCIGLGEQECSLIADAFHHVGRVQTLCGGALIALAASVFILARPRFFAPPASQSQPPPQP
jgi:hypothetical protein